MMPRWREYAILPAKLAHNGGRLACQVERLDVLGGLAHEYCRPAWGLGYRQFEDRQAG